MARRAAATGVGKVVAQPGPHSGDISPSLSASAQTLRSPPSGPESALRHQLHMAHHPPQGRYIAHDRSPQLLPCLFLSHLTSWEKSRIGPVHLIKRTTQVQVTDKPADMLPLDELPACVTVGGGPGEGGEDTVPSSGLGVGTAHWVGQECEAHPEITEGQSHVGGLSTLAPYLLPTCRKVLALGKSLSSSLSLAPWTSNDTCTVPVLCTVSMPKRTVTAGESQGIAQMGWLCLDAVGRPERQRVLPTCTPLLPLLPASLPVSLLASLPFHPQ